MVAVPAAIMAQVRRPTLRTHSRELVDGDTSVLCVRVSSSSRHVSTAKELLLCRAGPHGGVGGRNDAYEW